MKLKERIARFEAYKKFDEETESNNHYTTKYGLGEFLAEEFRDKAFDLLKGKLTKTQFMDYLEELIPEELIEDYNNQFKTD